MNAIAVALLADYHPVIHHALSLKQPWAALLAHGLKTVEVRRWTTAFRGRVLIHAARVPDDRHEAWAQLPAHLQEYAQLGGGIIGYGTLTGCKTYGTKDAFAADQGLHRNEPDWFEAGGLYGLCFADLHPLPFRREPGFFRIFEVDLDIDFPPVGEPAPATEVTRRFQRLKQSFRGKGEAEK